MPDKKRTAHLAKGAQFSISYNLFCSLSVSNVCQPEGFQSF